jgi:tetratricopeptide (TPR) repeat protein
VKDYPADAVIRDVQVGTAEELGSFLTQIGKPDEGKTFLSAGLTTAKALVAEFPEDSTYRRSLAHIERNLGMLFRNTGKKTEAERCLRVAVESLGAVAQKDPAIRDYQIELASTEQALGCLLFDMGQLAEGERLLEQALHAQEKIAEEFPDVCERRAAAVESLGWLAEHYWRTNRLQNADDAYRKLIAILKKLSVDCSQYPLYRYYLAKLFVACPCENLREPERALALAEELIRQQQNDPDSLECLGMAHYRAGKDFALARDALERSRLLYGRDRPLSCLYLSMVHDRLGQAEQAKRWLTRGQTAIERAVMSELYWESTRAETEQILSKEKQPAEK